MITMTVKAFDIIPNESISPPRIKPLENRKRPAAAHDEQLVALCGLTDISILAAAIAFTSLKYITQNPQHSVKFYKWGKHNGNNSSRVLE